MDEQAAAEEGAELPFDEGGQPRAVGARGGHGEEFLQVIVHDPVEDSAIGDTRGVRAHGGAWSAFRAARPSPRSA